MTYPRAHLVDPSGGVYHVCSRCVRRAWLCGKDRLTGYNFDHRRSWLEERILALSEIFAIDLYGYAVMSNHYHIILNVDPSKSLHWSEDIVDKWVTLCPIRSARKSADELMAAQRSALMQDSERLTVLRQRLTSLSWFMRFLNEPLARIANREEDCRGRFWEGRFKSQRLLDENAVLAAMVYVDLNPLRAGTASHVTEARHTSLRKRVTQPQALGPLTALNRPHKALPFDHTLDSYIDLACWTIEAQRDRRSSAYGHGPPGSPDLWLHHFLPKPGCWQRANGSLQSLKDYARIIGQRWIRIRSALPQH